MPKIGDVFPSNYIRASDLHGQQPAVIISHIEMEKVGREQQHKPVLYFKGKEKGLVLNRTNARMIATLVGSDDTDNWAGARIRLYATTVEFGGEMTEGIRVKAAGPQAAPARREPEPPPPPPLPAGDEPEPDDIPF